MGPLPRERGADLAHRGARLLGRGRGPVVGDPDQRLRGDEPVRANGLHRPPEPRGGVHPAHEQAQVEEGIVPQGQAGAAQDAPVLASRAEHGQSQGHAPSIHTAWRSFHSPPSRFHRCGERKVSARARKDSRVITGSANPPAARGNSRGVMLR